MAKKAYNPFLAALDSENRLKKLRSNERDDGYEEDFSGDTSPSAYNPFLAALEAEQALKKSREIDEEEAEQGAYEEAERAEIERQAGEEEGGEKKRGLASTIGNLFLSNTAKLANTTRAGVEGIVGLGQIGAESVLGDDESYQRKLNEVSEGVDERLYRDKGLFGAGSFWKDEEDYEKTFSNPGEFTKDIVGGGVGTATEIVPFGRGYQAATAAAKGASRASKIARGVAEGAGWGAAGGTAQELLDDDEFSAGNVLKSAATGGVMGGAGAYAGDALSAGARRLTGKVDDPASTSALTTVPKTAQTDESRLLGSGDDWRTKRADELRAELDYYKGRESSFKLEGGATTRTGDELREMQKKLKVLEAEENGINSIQFDAAGGRPKIDMDDPKQRTAVENELRATQTVLETPELPNKRASILDYARVPTDALRRIGLQKTADLVEGSFEKYRIADVNSGRQLRAWKDALGDDDAARRIFHSLDGDEVDLNPTERAVRDDIRSYLDKYADDLGLSEKQRVSEYITHVFDDVRKGKAVDPSYESLFDGKLKGGVNNPFEKSRTSESRNYSDDLWRVLDIYTKRANRKIHMEPAVKAISDTHGAVKDVDGRTARYLQSMHRAITLKPSRIDEIFNDVVGSVTRDKFGPNAGTRALRAWRQNVYRATLGLNFGSALRNVTQLTNTFTEVPPKDFATGLSQAMRSLANKSKGGQDDFYDEMIEMGIFDDAIHKQDIAMDNMRSMSGVRKQLEKVDPALFVFFNTAEKINRGASYAAAKSHALRKLNMSEQAARDYASDMVSKTQFKFNSIETPLMFNSQVGKTITQFASYPVRQAGYMAKTAKGAVTKDDGSIGLNKDEIAKIVKWTGANIAMAATLGEVLGFDLKDSLPNLTGLRDLKSPTSQFLLGGENKTGLVDVARGEDAYGNIPYLKDENGDFVLDAEGNKVVDRGANVRDFLGDQIGIVAPAGAQAKKTYEGIQTANRGTSETAGGGIRFETNPDRDLQSAVFGQYSTPEAREFYADKSNKALSAKQSDLVREKDPILRGEYINFFRTLQKTPTKKDAIGKKVDKAIENGEYEKARRLAAEHNAKIKSIRADLVDSVGGKISPDLEDYINSQYMVNYDYYRNKKRDKR